MGVHLNSCYLNVRCAVKLAEGESDLAAHTREGCYPNTKVVTVNTITEQM